MRRIVVPLLLGVIFLTFQTTLLTSTSHSEDQAGHRLNPHPLFGPLLPTDLGWNLSPLHGFSHGSLFWKWLRPLHPLQAPHLLCGAVFQGTVLFGKFHIPIPFRLHLWPGGGSPHPHPSKYSQSQPHWQPLSLVIHLPPSPVVFHWSDHPHPLFSNP